MRRIVSAALSIILAFALFVPMTSCGETDSEPFVKEDVVVRNFVDERFEFVALAARIAGFAHISTTRTNYHRRLDATFSDFRDHEAIQAMLETLHNFLDVFRLAAILEITEDGFEMRDWNTYRSDMQLRFDYTQLRTLVDKLNDLHSVTNFRYFFENEENQQYFMRLSMGFVQNVYRFINFEWFKQFGLDPDNMHVILMPSLTDRGSAQWVHCKDFNLKIAYSILGTGMMTSLSVTIHEFAHSFGNELAAQWLRNCLDFWSLTRETLQRGFVHPAYARVRIVAYEYVVRAVTILYMLDNTSQSLPALFQRDRNQGFRNIAEVFDMLMRYLGRYELIQSS